MTLECAQKLVVWVGEVASGCAKMGSGVTQGAHWKQKSEMRPATSRLAQVKFNIKLNTLFRIICEIVSSFQEDL